MYCFCACQMYMLEDCVSLSRDFQNHERIKLLLALSRILIHNTPFLAAAWRCLDSKFKLYFIPIVTFWKWHLWVCPPRLAPCLCSASLTPCTNLQVLCSPLYLSEAQLQGCCARPHIPTQGESGICPALSGCS